MERLKPRFFNKGNKRAGSIVILLCIKACCVFFTSGFSDGFKRIANGEWKEQGLEILRVNNDELLIAEVAINYNKGLGFVSSHEGLRKNYLYEYTAFRPTYPVYFHIVLMRAYKLFFPAEITIADSGSRYFKLYALLILFLSFVFYGVSLYFFRKTAGFYLDDKFAFVAMIFYGLYPSVLFYVGGFANYESIVASFIIIIFYILLKTSQGDFKKNPLMQVFFMTIISLLFRPQTNFIFIFLFATWIFACIKNLKILYYRRAVWFTFIVLSGYFICNVPVMIKNQRLFGSYFLTTSGTTFSLGHNPYARGGWCGNCFADHSTPYYQYINHEIPGYENLNEYDKSQKLQKLAMLWITQNPFAEVKLMVKKIAIYFLPYNNDNEKVNVLNLIVHLGTIIFLFRLFYLYLVNRTLSILNILLMMPVAGSLFVTIIIFAGYRWRYYAEPFMIIETMTIIQLLFAYFRKLHTKIENEN